MLVVVATKGMRIVAAEVAEVAVPAGLAGTVASEIAGGASELAVDLAARSHLCCWQECSGYQP